MTNDTPETDAVIAALPDEGLTLESKIDAMRTGLHQITRLAADLERRLAAAEKDAQRYRWLCDDLDADQRAMRSHILNRLSVMGKGAIDAAIDAAKDAP